jgi:large subunit ribosomal protein L41e
VERGKWLGSIQLLKMREKWRKKRMRRLKKKRRKMRQRAK